MHKLIHTLIHTPMYKLMHKPIHKPRYKPPTNGKGYNGGNRVALEKQTQTIVYSNIQRCKSIMCGRWRHE
jgi:hypothetical protein